MPKKNQYLSCGCLCFALCYLALASTHEADAQIYTVENLAAGNLIGQDGWAFVGGSSGFAVGQGGNVDPTKVLLGPSSFSAIAQRTNDANFTFGLFTGLETSVTLQLDIFPHFLADTIFALGRDSVTDGDNLVNQSSEIGPGFGTSISNGTRLVIREAGGGPLHVGTVTLANGSWYRLQLVIDFTANGGAGAGSLFYRNLSLGESSFASVPNLQNISLGILGTAADVRPATYDTMYLLGSYADLDNFGVVPEPSAVSLMVMSSLLFFQRRLRGTLYSFVRPDSA